MRFIRKQIIHNNELVVVGHYAFNYLIKKTGLSKYKLVGVFVSNRNQFATLVDGSGEFLTLELFEELSKGLKLVELNIKEAIFQKDENSFISINFKNQIRMNNE